MSPTVSAAEKPSASSGSVEARAACGTASCNPPSSADIPRAAHKCAPTTSSTTPSPVFHTHTMRRIVSPHLPLLPWQQWAQSGFMRCEWPSSPAWLGLSPFQPPTPQAPIPAKVGLEPALPTLEGWRVRYLNHETKRPTYPVIAKLPVPARRGGNFPNGNFTEIYVLEIPLLPIEADSPTGVSPGPRLATLPSHFRLGAKRALRKAAESPAAPRARSVGGLTQFGARRSHGAAVWRMT